MEMNDFRKLIIYKLSAIFLMVFFAGFTYLVISMPGVLGDYSIFAFGDIIEYNGKVVISVSGIPLFIWGFFFSLRVLLHKGMKPLKKATWIGNVWGVVSLASCCLGFIASFILPFVFMFSSYTSCNTDTYSNYYVIHPDLCKAIVTHRWGNK